MRVLHLIDGSSPQANSTTLALLKESLGRGGTAPHHTLLMGGPRLADAAKAAGITHAKTIGVPMARAVFGGPAVYRYARRHGPFDLIHCWSVGALSLSVMLFKSVPRVLTLTTLPGLAAIHWLRLLQRESPSRTILLPISSTIRRALLGGGVAEASVHLLRPGIDMGRIDYRHRDSLRRKWHADRDHVKVLALLNDTAHEPDALVTGIAVTMANHCASMDHFDLRLLVHPDQKNRRRLENIDRPARVIQEPRLAYPWSVLPGCDLVLSLGSGGGGLSLLWAMASNTPIVGEATYGACEVVEDRHSALLAKPNSTPGLARRITTLLGDKSLAWKLRDTARHEAYSFFSCHRYRQSLQVVYEQILEGGEVAVPPMEVTGGLRFAGRA